MWKKCWSLLCVCGVLILGMNLYRIRQLDTAQSSLPSFSQSTQAQTLPEAERLTQEQTAIAFPYAMESFPLTLENLMIYEGPFREDGTDTPAVNAMAVILENTGDTDILSLCLELRQGQRILTFEAYCIPAGKRIMVVEREKQEYSSAPITACRCVSLETGYLDAAPQITLEPFERCDVLVTNTGSETVNVTLVYKLYMPSQELYLGGIAYSMELTDLEPGETRMVRPYPFTWNGGRIVAVSAEKSSGGVQ